MEQKNFRNQEQDRRLNLIEQHISVINGELGEIKGDIKGIQKDINWIKRFIFALLPILAGMIVSLIYIVLNIK